MTFAETRETALPAPALPWRAAGLSAWRRWLLLLPFLALFYVQLAHHALWRDELNAFGIAAGSPTLHALYENVRYEGHPWLWYVLLWMVSKATHNPLAMKWVEAMIGTAVYVVLGVLSPFRWWERVLLFASYYIAFEYLVLSRMYGVVLLLVLLYLRRRMRPGAGLAGNAVLLGLMVSTDVTGVFLSIAFLAEYLYSLWRPGDGAPVRPTRRGVWCGCAVYAVALLLAVLSMLPQPDASKKLGEGLLYGAAARTHLIRIVVSDVAIPYLPTLTGVPGVFWDTTVKAQLWLFTLMLPVVLLAYWLVLHRYPNLLVLLGTDVLLTVSFGYLIYLGKPRHYGMTFLTFVACLWMLRAMRKRVHPAAYALLLLSAAGGVHATLGSWQRPFSNAQATAAWLKQTGYNQLPLVGSQDYTVFGVAVALQQPMYMLDCQCERSFLRIDAERDGYTWDMLPERMPLAQAAWHANRMVLVTAHPVDAQNTAALMARGFALTPLKEFPGSEIPEDNFWVYLVQAGAARPGA